MAVPRETCLYCEQEGTVTKLVPLGNHWGCCPIHSADYLARCTPPSVAEALARAGVDSRSSRNRETERIRKLTEYRAIQDSGE